MHSDAERINQNAKKDISDHVLLLLPLLPAKCPDLCQRQRTTQLMEQTTAHTAYILASSHSSLCQKEEMRDSGARSWKAWVLINETSRARLRKMFSQHESASNTGSRRKKNTLHSVWKNTSKYIKWVLWKKPYPMCQQTVLGRFRAPGDGCV